MTKNTLPELLHSILTLKRPAHGKGVEAVKDIISNEIDNFTNYNVIEDEYGNLICTTSFTGVLFSCHTDTMHFRDGTNEIHMDKFGIITAWRKVEECDHNGTQDVMKRDILGADDGTGIYIMLEMIKADVPGTYVFHADEEIGCCGSNALSKESYSIDGRDLEADFTHAIAFDRKGTSDLIFEQLSEMMCSVDCRKELLRRLNHGNHLDYMPATGIVTDTAMYADLVPECINLSVGYYDEHTVHERQDFSHLEVMLNHILNNPGLFTNLPVSREPGADTNWAQPVDDYEVVKSDTVAGLCHQHPTAISQLLETLGYDYSELFDILTAESLIT